MDTWGATREEALTTFTLAAVTATIATGLAFAWGTVLVKAGNGWARLLLILLLAIPAPLVGIGLIVTMNNDLLGWFYPHLIADVVSVALALIPALRQVPKEIEEESRLCGATTLQYYLFVKVPMVWRGLLAAWLISFIRSIGELGASFLVTSLYPCQ